MFIRSSLSLQVVWANSYALGCGVHRCTNGLTGTSLGQNGGATIVVCNYGPA